MAENIFDSMDKMFQEGEGAEKYQVLKSLLDKNNIEMKTDLTPKQIKGIILLEYIIRLAKEECDIDLGYLKMGVARSLKIHNVSKNRLSRGEIIAGLQSDNEEKKINKIKEGLGI